MNSTDAVFVGKEFAVGMRRQKTWRTDMAVSFFFGELGAGLFLLSLYFNFIPGLIAGLLITTVGKSVGHLLHLGRPERAFRAITKLGSSWLSRGLLAIILYTGCGGLYVLNHFFAFMPANIANVFALIAAAASILIMLYQGLIMSHSGSITLWASGLMPVLGLAYGLSCASSVLLAAVSSEFMVVSGDVLASLKTLQAVLLLVAAVAVWGLLHAASWGSAGGQESVNRLVKQDLAPWFIGVVIGIGFVMPALMIGFGSSVNNAAIITAIAQLVGFVSFRLVILKAGNYDAILTFTRSHRAF